MAGSKIFWPSLPASVRVLCEKSSLGIAGTIAALRLAQESSFARSSDIFRNLLGKFLNP